MYRRVVVPLDGSPLAQGIVPFIMEIAGPLDFEVVLVRVVQPITRSKKAGVRATSVLLEGPLAERIVHAAKSRRADLIVMGTHGRSGLAKLFLGSVAERVVATAPCPVLTVRGR